jgi:hypothetical protein
MSKGATTRTEPAEASSANSTPAPATKASPTVEPKERIEVAAVAPTAPRMTSTNAVAPSSPVSKEAADESGIPPSSRRLLLIVGSAVAMSLLAYRYALKSRLNRERNQ